MQNKQLSLFWPKFAQKCILGQNLKNLSVDLESASPRYHKCQFSGKRDNFQFFHINLGKLPNYMLYFGSNNVEGVAKNSVGFEMSWMEVGPRFSNNLKFIYLHIKGYFMAKNSFVVEVIFKKCSIDFIV